eukprot:TRINITY_DN32478_c0_g1_i1.p2 TRINITY_DN32478_c0_g1~~TRINITY_DN32478_c0_g1_i1.p2  ORF type:complete len:161 (-),score=26.85 TRINITY_DN32478_c0_g1_i1:717-1199(-)
MCIAGRYRVAVSQGKEGDRGGDGEECYGEGVHEGQQQWQEQQQREQEGRVKDPLLAPVQYSSSRKQGGGEEGSISWKGSPTATLTPIGGGVAVFVVRCPCHDDFYQPSEYWARRGGTTRLLTLVACGRLGVVEAIRFLGEKQRSQLKQHSRSYSCLGSSY